MYSHKICKVSNIRWHWKWSEKVGCSLDRNKFQQLCSRN